MVPIYPDKLIGDSAAYLFALVFYLLIADEAAPSTLGTDIKSPQCFSFSARPTPSSYFFLFPNIDA
jgi:hypothetical protein